jgi:hypothetical protein
MTLRRFANGSLQIYDFKADNTAVWAKDSNGRWTRLDPKTLQIVARGTAGPASG